MKTTLTPAAHEAKTWEEALGRARLFKVTTPDGKTKFDILLMGHADYVAVNLNSQSEYDPKGQLQLFSINGEFRMWVEEGMKGRIRGVRWPLEKRGDKWSLYGDHTARLAIELVMGERVDEQGYPLA